MGYTNCPKWVRSVNRSMPVVTLLIAALVPGSMTDSLRAQARRQLFVSLLEQDGTAVSELMPSDVSVMEDGAVGKTIAVDPIDWPMKLTVLLDNGSRGASYITEMRTALESFFNQIPAGVEVSIVTLAPQPRTVLRPTMARTDWLKSVGLLTPGVSVRVGVPMGAGPAPGAPRGNPNLPSTNGVAVAAGVLFFDGLAEAAARVEKDRSNYFPVFLMVTSDVRPDDAPLDRDVKRLVDRVATYGITVHFVTVGFQNPGGLQASLGGALTKISGGRNETINSPSRLLTLLPEIGQQIARSHYRQSHQYRVTYEPPQLSKGPGAISVGVIPAKSGASSTLTLNGRLP